MKSKMKFEVNQSESEVNFLDVCVQMKDGKISTSLYTKPTDSHLYLHSSSSHPSHVIKNIPKGQFLRLRRICSNTHDFITHANNFINYFSCRGYDKKAVEHAAREAMKADRETLLNKTKLPKKKTDSQSIFVTTYHPKLRNLSSLFKRHFHFIQNDSTLSKIFESSPLVAFKRRKSIRNFVVRNDVKLREEGAILPTTKCGRKICKKTCHLISNEAVIHNKLTGKEVKAAGGSCCSKNVVYAIKCKKHDLLYIGHTGEELSVRMSKHRYDFLKRPNNNELAKHLRESPHDFEKDVEVSIIKQNVTTAQHRELIEDRFICKLGTLQPNGMNLSLHQYGEDMYGSYQNVFAQSDVKRSTSLQ